MLLRIVYYFVLSILAVGIYHSVHEWVQEQMAFYFQVSKVKKTDKIFELSSVTDKHLVEPGNTKNERWEDGNKNSGKELEDTICEINEMEKEQEDLFHFIDSL